MKYDVKISDALTVPLEAYSADEAARLLPELVGQALFDNALIRMNTRKFEAAVDGYFADKDKYRPLYAEFTHCPEILAELWGGSRPVYMPYAVLDKLERMPTPKKQGHHIPLDIIKQLPTAIHDPIMVFSSAMDITGKSLIALLDLQSPDPRTKQMQNLCTVVEFDVKGRLGLVDIVKSTYGRPDHQYKSWFFRDRSTIYMDTKRARKWLPVTGLQLSGVKPFSSPCHTILTKAEFVKARTKKILPEVLAAFKDIDPLEELLRPLPETVNPSKQKSKEPGLGL